MKTDLTAERFVASSGNIAGGVGKFSCGICPVGTTVVPDRQVESGSFSCINAAAWSKTSAAKATSCVQILTFWPECCEEAVEAVKEDGFVCLDTNAEKVDAKNNGCSWYLTNEESCGLTNSESFDASEMCCACGGGVDSDEMSSITQTITVQTASTGQQTLFVQNVSDFSAGGQIAIRSPDGFVEFKNVTSIASDSIIVDTALNNTYATGASVTAMSSVAFDCTAGYATWKLGWSVMKQTWCCQNEGKGCAFDCNAGASNWASWSNAKKTFCSMQKPSMPEKITAASITGPQAPPPKQVPDAPFVTNPAPKDAPAAAAPKAVAPKAAAAVTEAVPPKAAAAVTVATPAAAAPTAEQLQAAAPAAAPAAPPAAPAAAVVETEAAAPRSKGRGKAAAQPKAAAMLAPHRRHQKTERSHHRSAGHGSPRSQSWHQ